MSILQQFKVHNQPIDGLFLANTSQQAAYRAFSLLTERDPDIMHSCIDIKNIDTLEIHTFFCEKKALDVPQYITSNGKQVKKEFKFIIKKFVYEDSRNVDTFFQSPCYQVEPPSNAIVIGFKCDARRYSIPVDIINKYPLSPFYGYIYSQCSQPIILDDISYETFGKIYNVLMNNAIQSELDIDTLHILHHYGLSNDIAYSVQSKLQSKLQSKMSGYEKYTKVYKNHKNYDILL